MKAAFVVVHDPCDVMLDFPGTGTFEDVPYGHGTVLAEVREALIPELLLEEIRAFVDVYPAWVDVLAQRDGKWTFVGDTLS